MRKKTSGITELAELDMPSSLRDSLDFLKIKTDDAMRHYGNQYNSLCAKAYNDLITYKKHHPNKVWYLYCLAVVHLATKWKNSNTSEGLQYCQDAMEANDIQACMLWGYANKDLTKNERLTGIKKIEAMALQHNEQALHAVITILLHGYANILTPNLEAADELNKEKLHAVGDYSRDLEIEESKLIQEYQRIQEPHTTLTPYTTLTP